MADAVLRNRSATGKIPASREKNREFCVFAAIPGMFDVEDPRELGRFGRVFPKRRTGNLLRGNREFLRIDGIKPDLQFAPGLPRTEAKGPRADVGFAALRFGPS